MTQLNPREIERRLREQPAPPPPPELVERLMEEIPAAEAEPSGETPRGRKAGSRRQWAAAAALFVAVGGGFLAYRSMREGDHFDALAHPGPESVVETQPLPADPRPETELERLRSLGYVGSSDKSDVQGDTSGAATPAQRFAGERERHASALRRELDALSAPTEPAQARATERDLLLEPEPRPQAQVEEVVTVTSESPMLDERRIQAIAAPPPPAEVLEFQLKSPLPGPPPPVAESPTTSYQARLMPRAKRADGPGRPEIQPPPGPPPSTGGTAEPNDEPYGDMFFRSYGVNPFIDTEDDRFSTFGLDVDTGSYSLARNYLEEGHLPPHEAIRVEELINYFDYGDAPPAEGDFALQAQLGPAPFAAGERYRLLRFGVRARDVEVAERDPATLVFVVDVSGSMNRENRLGLVKRSLALLLDELHEGDRVGLVIYGSRGQVLLEPTSDLDRIRQAIGRLRAGGSTNAEEGLVLAYGLAGENFRRRAINRVVLCSDGVANVGSTGPESILKRIAAEADRGIELTTVGFGMGNYNDVLMEQLADRGNGSYAYVDDLAEAKRIFVENLTGTLQTIASDAKVQVEFNPQTVSRYRLLGYENRDIADELFRDDTVDAGEIGAGHSVTALYEIKLQPKAKKSEPLATLRLRYRSKQSGRVEEVERAIRGKEAVERWRQAPRELRLAALVAEYGEILKGSYWARQSDPKALLARAQEVSADYPGDVDVAEFVALVGKLARLAE